MTKNRSMRVVALGGGAGTRFWPVSRDRLPKQLLRLAGAQTLLGATFERVRSLVSPDRWWMVVGHGHAEACRKGVPEVPELQVLVEPTRRSTAPAIALAAVHVERQDPDAIIVVLPADHTIGDPEAFLAALRTAAEVAAHDGLATLGITPTHAETAYGYIQRGEPDPRAPGAFRVTRFIEKPSFGRAEELLAAGDCFWNAGIFVMKVGTYLGELELQLPDVLHRMRSVQDAIATPGYSKAVQQAYDGMESISIDYGIMENAPDISVVPVKCEWSDVGSWNAMSALLAPDEGNNTVHGRTVLVDCSDNIIYAEEGHVVGAVGMQGVVIVHTADATLVIPASRSQDVRDIIVEIEKQGWKEYL